MIAAEASDFGKLRHSQIGFQVFLDIVYHPVSSGRAQRTTCIARRNRQAVPRVTRQEMESERHGELFDKQVSRCRFMAHFLQNAKTDLPDELISHVRQVGDIA